MLDELFSPASERASLEALLRRARRHTPERPLWLLCPSGPAQQALAEALARPGGGFAVAAPWPHLAAHLEALLELPAHNAEFDPLPALLEALRPEPIAASLDSTALDGLARSLLPSLEALRSAGWRGGEEVLRAALRGPEDPASRPLGLLARLLSRVEEPWSAAGNSDLPARLWRLAELLPTRPVRPLSVALAWIDTLSPCEAAVLEALRAAQSELLVQPWVLGWKGPSARPVAPAAPAPRWLDALARSEQGCATAEGSVQRLHATDTAAMRAGIEKGLRGLAPQDACTVAFAAPGELHGRLEAALGAACERTTEHSRGAEDPLWHSLRAALLLGSQRVDLLAALAFVHGPASGIHGTDRDRLAALLRRRRPARLADLEPLILEATDPKFALVPATDSAPEVLDPARLERLEHARAQLQRWLSLWDTARQRRADPAQRVDATEELLDGAVNVHERVVRYWRGEAPERIDAALGALSAARAAGKRHLEELRARKETGSLELTELLEAIARALPSSPPRGLEGQPRAARVLSAPAWSLARPAVLVAMDFREGAWPRRPAPLPLLGPLERRRLAEGASVLPGLAALATDDARELAGRRAVLRTLAMPTERLLLVHSKRDACGAPAAEPLLVQDLLRHLAKDAQASAATRPLERELAAAPPPPRSAELLEQLLAAQDPASALRAALPERPWLADRTAAWWRPEKDFAHGAEPLGQLAARELTARDLDSLLRCRYRFVHESLLGLRELSLRTFEGLSAGALSSLAATVSHSLRAAPEQSTEELLLAMQSQSAALKALPELERLSALRQLRRFAERLRALRGALAVPASADPAPEERVLELSLASGASEGSRTLKVKVLPPALEHATVSGAVVPVGLLPTGGNAERLALHAANTVGSELALAAEVAGASKVAVLALSLGKQEAAVATPAQSAGAFPERVGALVLRPTGELPAEELTAALRSALGAQLDRIATSADGCAPHSAEERRRLVQLGARSCEGCASALGCRFREAR